MTIVHITYHLIRLKIYSSDVFGVTRNCLLLITRQLHSRKEGGAHQEAVRRLVRQSCKCSCEAVGPQRPRTAWPNKGQRPTDLIQPPPHLPLQTRSSHMYLYVIEPLQRRPIIYNRLVEKGPIICRMVESYVGRQKGGSA